MVKTDEGTFILGQIRLARVCLIKNGNKAFYVKGTAHVKIGIVWENLEHFCMTEV